MATKASDFGVDFLNINLKFDVELLADDSEILSSDDLYLWVSQATRNHIKFGFGYNHKSKSYTVSVTDNGSVIGDAKPACLTQHGKSHVSALQKCHFIIEICGRGTLVEEVILDNLVRREEVLQEQLAKLLRK